MRLRLSFPIKASVTAFVILLSASYCGAQVSMQFSFYTNGSISSDGQYVYNGASIQDLSSGCYHYNYNSQAIIWSPDGRVSAMGGGGLSPSASIAINGVAGDYSLSANTQFTCSCINYSTASFGGGGAVFTAAINYVAATSLTTDSAGYCAQRPNCTNSPPYRCNISKIYTSAQGPGYICPPFSETLSSVVAGFCIVSATIDYSGPGYCTPAP